MADLLSHLLPSFSAPPRRGSPVPFPCPLILRTSSAGLSRLCLKMVRSSRRGSSPNVSWNSSRLIRSSFSETRYPRSSSICAPRREPQDTATARCLPSGPRRGLAHAGWCSETSEGEGRGRQPRRQSSGPGTASRGSHPPAPPCRPADAQRSLRPLRPRPGLLGQEQSCLLVQSVTPQVAPRGCVGPPSASVCEGLGSLYRTPYNNCTEA